MRRLSVIGILLSFSFTAFSQVLTREESLLHGGKAEQSGEHAKNPSNEDRAALIMFLESL